MLSVRLFLDGVQRLAGIAPAAVGFVDQDVVDERAGLR